MPESTETDSTETLAASRALFSCGASTAPVGGIAGSSGKAAAPAA